MNAWRLILCLLFGERGPADLVVTRSANDTHFRLPNRHPNLRVLTSLRTVLLVLGAYAVFLVIDGTLDLPEEERSYLGMTLGVIAILLAMFAAYRNLHVNWHYELVLTPEDLAILHVSPGRQWRIARIEMAPIRQFTILPRYGKTSLQAEASDHPPRLLLQNQDHDLMLQLADLLATEHARLNGEAAAIRVKIEEFTVGASQPRLEPPLNSKIVVTKHEAGVTFDFPLPMDDREATRRRAWRAFEIGILLLLSSIVWVAVCGFMGSPAAGLCVPVFLAGLGTLIAAAQMMNLNNQVNKMRDEDLVQLGVLGDLLIRTTRDHSKQIWYRKEIRGVTVEEQIEETTSQSEGGTQSFSIYYVRVMLELHAGDKVPLATRASTGDGDDYRKKAELEWIATVLRQALQTEALPIPPHAIQVKNGYADETHITQ